MASSSKVSLTRFLLLGTEFKEPRWRQCIIIKKTSEGLVMLARVEKSELANLTGKDQQLRDRKALVHPRRGYGGTTALRGTCKSLPCFGTEQSCPAGRGATAVGGRRAGCDVRDGIGGSRRRAADSKAAEEPFATGRGQQLKRARGGRQGAGRVPRRPAAESKAEQARRWWTQRQAKKQRQKE